VTRLRRLLSGEGPLLLDGAVGTELQRRGWDVRLPLWSARALVDERGRALLAEVHGAYARAGAAVLTTNTFRTTRRALERAGLLNRWALLNRYAVEAARSGAGGSAGGTRAEALVAGSIAPLEDCYTVEDVPTQADCLREHLMQADLLARLGVDLLLVETMNCGREARAAVLAARAVGLDALLSLCPGAPDALLSGEPLVERLPRLIDAGSGCIAGVLLNCATPGLLERAAPGLARLAGGLPWGVYAHLGEPDDRDGWRLPDDHQPEEYAAWGAERRREGAAILGGCCGTTPEHIACLARAVSRPIDPPGPQGIQ
jgi:S-methylmethionine-dependent homocysteine/selenocysteine methylase